FFFQAEDCIRYFHVTGVQTCALPISWENRQLYEKWSPHRYIHTAKTTMLIIHGAYDFRVSEEQAFQVFTSLQRLGVKSKFLYFPDETHFVTKPQNSLLWWDTIFNWFNEHKKEEDI